MMTTSLFPDDTRQWVCLQCGYNKIGEMPEFARPCVAGHDQFMTWHKVETRHRVIRHPVNAGISQWLSVPTRGLEHAANRIETESGAVLIDSPWASTHDLPKVSAIFFTHHHFLVASN